MPPYRLFNDFGSGRTIMKQQINLARSGGDSVKFRMIHPLTVSVNRTTTDETSFVTIVTENIINGNMKYANQSSAAGKL